MTSLCRSCRPMGAPKLIATVGILALSMCLTSLPSRPLFAQDAALTIDTQDLPLSPIERAEKAGTALHLSLKDLTKLALQNNLDIAISDTNEELYQQKVLQTYGPYDPAFSFTLGVRSTKSPNTNQTNRALQSNFNKTDTAQWNVQFSQNIPTGGAITGYFNSNRSDTNQLFALFSPQYTASTQIQFTQPLRRNLHIDQYRSAIKLANLDIETNDSQFKQKVTDTISKIQGLYWDLVGAVRDYEIKRESVKLADITLQNNRKKVAIGTLAPIGITEAMADKANREVDLISAEQTINNAQNSLRGLISNDLNAPIWQQVIVPTENAEFKNYEIKIDDAIDTALKNRPELEQVAIKLKQNDISYRLDSNLKKWQFDFVGQFGSQGVAGPQSIDPITGKPEVPPELVGGVLDAYKTVFIGGFTNWFLGFNVQIPLKNRSLEAQLGQLKVQNRQLLMNRKVVEQQIVVDIRNAVQALETRKKQVDTARVASQLAREQMEGEEKRFQAGLSQNFLVLDRQRALSAAQGQELQTLIAYKKAVIDLQKGMYTLLESNDFEIAKTSSDSVPDLK